MSHTRLFRIAVRARDADPYPVAAIPGRDFQTVHQLCVHRQGTCNIRRLS